MPGSGTPPPLSHAFAPFTHTWPLATENPPSEKSRNTLEKVRAEIPDARALNWICTSTPLPDNPVKAPLIESATPESSPGKENPVIPVSDPPPAVAARSKSLPTSVKLSAVRMALL